MNTPIQTGLSFEDLQRLRALSTCDVANAIEAFNVRLRNEGFAQRSIRSMYDLPESMVGYAVTLSIRSSSPPIDAPSYIEKTTWWETILNTPAPRVVVIQDVDPRPGSGALLGGVHANILNALGCIGAATNGSVRDLSQVRSIPFHLFATGPAVSHAYAHIVSMNEPVEIGGLKIHPGDLIHGDSHGILSIPRDIASRVPDIAAEMAIDEHSLIAICRGDFSIEALRTAVHQLRIKRRLV